MEITRRAFLGAGAAAVTSTALGLGFPSGTSSRPNVLFIITDEQSLWTISQFG